MIVRDLMTTPALSVAATASIVDALKLMIGHRVSGIPVLDKDGALVGLLSEADFMRRSELKTEAPKPSWWRELFSPLGDHLDAYIRTHGRTVEDVMSKPVVTIGPDAPLSEAVDLMTKHNVKRLPVVENGSLAGIITRMDLLRALVEALPPASEASVEDEALEAAVNGELTGEQWGRNGQIRASVVDGVVTLFGTVFDEKIRVAARIAAENVPGVKSVRDDTVLIEPMSGTIIDPLPRL